MIRSFLVAACLMFMVGFAIQAQAAKLSLNEFTIQGGALEGDVIKISAQRGQTSAVLSGAPSSISFNITPGRHRFQLVARDSVDDNEPQTWIVSVAFDFSKGMVFCASRSKDKKYVKGKKFPLPDAVKPGKKVKIVLQLTNEEYQVVINGNNVAKVPFARHGHSFDPGAIRNVLVIGDVTLSGIAVE